MGNLVAECTYIVFYHCNILLTYKCNKNNREKEIMNEKTEIRDNYGFAQIHRNVS